MVEGGFIDDESVLRGVDYVLVRLLSATGVTSLGLHVVVNFDVGVVDLLHKCHGAVIAPDLQHRSKL